MKYIKKFESNTDNNESIDACKDYIETLPDFYPDLNMSSYADGYHNGSRFMSRLENESYNRCIMFTISYSNTNNQSEKEDVDNIIKIIQFSKSVLTKLKLFSDNIKFTVNNSYATFYVLFENTNTEQKNEARARRIYDAVVDAFSNYHTKRISTTNKILKNLAKDNNTTQQLRYSLSINRNKNVISVAVSNFRFGNISKKLTLSSTQLEYVMKYILDYIKNRWRLSDEKDKINYKIEGSIIYIELL